MSTETDLAELGRLCEAATPGPWTHKKRYGMDEDGARYPLHYRSLLIRGTDYGLPPEDAAFIAAARTALPKLLTLLADRDAEIVRLREVVEAARAWVHAKGGQSWGPYAHLREAVSDYESQTLDSLLSPSPQGASEK